MRDPSQLMQPLVFAIEDEPEQIDLYARVLQDCEVRGFSSAASAMEECAHTVPDLILLDNMLGKGCTGVEALGLIRDRFPQVPVILITGTLGLREGIDAMQGRRGAHYFLEKPVDVAELERIAAEALAECGTWEAVEVLRALERLEKEEWSDPDRRFTDRMERQAKLLNALRSPQESSEINLTHMAQRFGVDRRTLRRDIDDLMRRRQGREPHRSAP
jgi:CheY-like chemotaxis protein